MKCNEISQQIVPFYTGELSEAKVQEYKRHTMICKKCARYTFKIRRAVEYAKKNSQPIVKIKLME
ncbi:MAG: hypothetical protein LBC07_00395 [Elusimicrobiota bacterium]|jgi:hypothetical protein|nr:hypothetical protein [Elusimicrobiota bacterium]